MTSDVVTPTVLTFAQAAELLNISLRQFRRLVDSGKIPFVKISERAPRVRVGDIEKFLGSVIVHRSEDVPMPKVLHTRVYKRVRRSHGKLVATYRGYFTLEKNGARVWKELGTPDRAIAEKRIQEFALIAQHEQEGFIPARSVREAAVKPLVELVKDYEADQISRELVAQHIHNTKTRISRIIAETRWRTVKDIRADEFVAWRSTLQCAAKTKKEYQISFCAFLTWLVKTDQILESPLAKIDTVETRGKQVRPSRSFTEDELRRRLAVVGKRKLAYQVFLYTGQRKSEVRALVWGDLHLEAPQPFAHFRASTTKDKDKRLVPLRKEVAAALLAARPPNFSLTQKVFWFAWPTYDILRGDLKRAGIEWKDTLGRVVHFHSFRKTWQTLGVRYGINQRAAQEVLGQSDANLTAEVYTDVPELALHDEIAKRPWISSE